MQTVCDIFGLSEINYMTIFCVCCNSVVLIIICNNTVILFTVVGLFK